MKKIKSLCVYCGSRPGNNENFRLLAKKMGEIMSKNQIELIYGGGNVGLMGIIATSVMDNGGQVHGIIPGHLDKTEIAHPNLTKLTIVENMHQRKRLMFDHSDAFLVLPGSIGTLDETIEVITWKQLKLHDKPIILLNSENYWNPFMELLRNIINYEFTMKETLDLFNVVNSPDEVLPLLESLPEPKIDPKNTLF
ncbi:MAG: TIGR00730 family Rossman fold protein [Alphaproteobacteria bacterium]|nr:TIGR00730 family Rossman fold protein [Alphaproteobacteria bacterium]HPF46657.1 TIGR00730 family Rossman fold protein [Emcibacteraceae bacterium]HRW29422.1 TIGR00730 family Rossman fold protein [Emcibacteraceae bacterium]